MSLQERRKWKKMQQEHNSKQTSGGVESLQEGINPFCTQGLIPTHYLPTEKIPAGKECGDGAGRRQTNLWKSKHLFLNSGVSAQP